MLDPTPAFTSFGRVTASIAVCEEIMRLALVHREFEAAVRIDSAGPDRFSPFVHKLMKWDFGQLSHRFRTQLRLPDDPWLQIFKDAKYLRNSVAHNFWAPNYGLLRSERGVEVIVRHCGTLERHFSHLADGLMLVADLNPTAFIEMVSEKVRVDEAIRGFEALLADAEAVQLPPWR